jgi:hypothetical protein
VFLFIFPDRISSTVSVLRRHFVPLKTALNCPHCREVGYTTRKIPPGAKVRCTRCGQSFAFDPRPSGDNDDLPTVGDTELGTLRQFFNEEESPPLAGLGESTKRIDVETEQPFTRSAMLPPVRRDKAIISGKPLRFEGSRKVTAAVVILVVAAAGYAGVMTFLGFLREHDKTYELINEKRKADKKIALKDILKPSSDPKKEISKIPSTPQEPSKMAGDPMRIDKLEVCVIEASEARVDQSRPEKRLSIKLSVKNVTEQPVKYPCWIHPQNKLELRDESPNMVTHPLVVTSTEMARTLKPGEQKYELLHFGQTPRFYGLRLDLPLWDDPRSFRFNIPVEYIQRFE